MKVDLNILKKIIEEITESDIDNFCDEDNIVEKYDIDSMAMIQLVVAIEEKFNIDIPYEYLDVNSLSNVSDLVKMIETLSDLREDK